MTSRRAIFLVLFLLTASAAILIVPAGRNAAWAAFTRLRGRITIEERLVQLPDAARRAESLCTAAGLSWPPEFVFMVADKRATELHLLARAGGAMVPLARYAILGASGAPGPKLRRGDRQVPEGIYDIESLNPNSRFHLSLRVGYPNAFDRARATEDGRTDLGGDIMIHGGTASIGCIAIGDPAIEELFALVAATGVERARVLIAPSLNPREEALSPEAPAWLPELYAMLGAELREFGMEE